MSLGDYCAGSNHVLPTGCTARHASGLSVQSFLRGVHLVDYDRDALVEVAPQVIALAEAEDLPAHGAAVRGPDRAMISSSAIRSRTMQVTSAGALPSRTQRRRPPVSRTGRVERSTAETKVLVEIDLDGTGAPTSRPGSASSTTC